MTEKTLVEVCVESVQGVVAAEQGGADRAELCSDLVEGGLTPSMGTLQAARRRSKLDLMVIVRPRGGDFLYSEIELEIMRWDVEVAREGGASGVVLGLLKEDGTVDVEQTGELIEQARPLSVTFHRAFDMTPDPREALEQLVGLGVDRVLTSGQEAAAEDSLELLRDLVRQAGERIVVMPCGGLNPDNLRRVVEQTGAREVHFAALATEQSPMRFQNPRLGMGAGAAPGEYQRTVTDPALVRAGVQALRGVH